MSQPINDRWTHGTGRDVSWMDRAACSDQDPERFFPKRHPEKVQAFCRRCPVVLECGLYALAETYDGHPLEGVWGGLTARQRAAVNKTRRAS